MNYFQIFFRNRWAVKKYLRGFLLQTKDYIIGICAFSSTGAPALKETGSTFMI